MNGWCNMIIWYVSYVANMYLWVFHGIPVLLHLVLSCTVSRQISSERMRNGIGTLKVTATGAGEPCDKRIPRSDEVKKTSEKTRASHLTWCRPLSFKRRSWRRHFQSRVNNFNSSTLWILANEMLLFCSGAGRASKRRLLEMGLWLIYLTSFPSWYKLSLKILIEFWAWGGCPQGRLFCFWWYRQMQKQPCFHRSFAALKVAMAKCKALRDVTEDDLELMDGPWEDNRNNMPCSDPCMGSIWKYIYKIHLLGSQDKREKLWSVYAVFVFHLQGCVDQQRFGPICLGFGFTHMQMSCDSAQKPMSARNFPKEKGCQDEMYLLRICILLHICFHFLTTCAQDAFAGWRLNPCSCQHCKIGRCA